MPLPVSAFLSDHQEWSIYKYRVHLPCSIHYHNPALWMAQWWQYVLRSMLSFIRSTSSRSVMHSTFSSIKLQRFYILMHINVTVMSKWNVRLNLSWVAVTKTLGTLRTQLLSEVLGESTGVVGVQVIRGDEGVGDIPGIRGGSGGSVGSAQQDSIVTRTQT